jgi:hypothetical protein
MKKLIKLITVAGMVAIALAGLGSVAAAGVSGPAFYIDGQLYRTVGTPTDFSGTGAPDHSYNTIYDLGGVQPNVAVTPPGSKEFRGGRWMVHLVTFNTDYATTLNAHDLNGNGVLDNAMEIESALQDGTGAGATDQGVVRMFECPVIKVPGNNP